ncbi:MAG TPA: OmpA family protein [Ohtaekwangia sp.]|nr:OmpA family protein [Ohtaekwangia sp.]
MKNFAVLLILSGALLSPKPVFSQATRELRPGYYVVVGAYAKSRENVAQNYVEVLRLKGLSPDYGFNSSKNLYFVYLKYFTDLKTSLREMSQTRKTTDFKDAWVRVVPGDIRPEIPTVQTPPEVSPESVPAEDNAPNTTTSSADTATVATATEEITENPEIRQYNPMTLGNTEVFLSLFNGRNNRIVDGEVQVIDTERSRAMTKVKGNEYLILPDPKSRSGQLTLICEAFGYRKIQQEINYPLPLADTVKPYIDLMGTTLVINFDMVRYHKGDIGTLFNVYFFNDAAIMLPESKFELNSLLQMMEENTGYRILLHGHTNGNYHGKIITLGPNKDFFWLEGAKEGIGSAKDLAYNRAEIIKEYLIANGISADRMEIKSWGGKRPLYDKHSANAKRNVRVEVEILEE